MKDDEGMGGSGSTYDYGMRIYNPALCRFLSIDPLTAKFSMLTPYQYASNNPIALIDLDGLEGTKPKINWGDNANIEVVSSYSKQVIQSIAQEAGVTKVTVTSTYRDPAYQIGIMYDNLQGGDAAVKSNLKLYGPSGDAVINEFVAASKIEGATPESIKAAMMAKANEVGFVSDHSGENYSEYNVIDISYSSLTTKQYNALLQAALSDPRISVVKGKAEGDKALHIEIYQDLSLTNSLYESNQSQGDFYTARADYWLEAANNFESQGASQAAEESAALATNYTKMANKSYKRAARFKVEQEQ
jgi:RHS repeat-associated protein